jgi:hypothetical protein
MRLRVQDIPTSINADELQALFEPFGEVLWVEIAYDEISRRPLGHAFIEIREWQTDGRPHAYGDPRRRRFTGGFGTQVRCPDTSL